MLNHLNFYIFIALCIFVSGDRKDYKFDVKVECASHILRTTNSPLLGCGQVMWPITKFWGSSHITGTAEPKVVKICTRLSYVNSNNMMTYHQQKGVWLWSRDCFKILPFVVMQHIARVCQRQLSYRYLFWLVDSTCTFVNLIRFVSEMSTCVLWVWHWSLKLDHLVVKRSQPYECCLYVKVYVCVRVPTPPGNS